MSRASYYAMAVVITWIPVLVLNHVETDGVSIGGGLLTLIALGVTLAVLVGTKRGLTHKNQASSINQMLTVVIALWFTGIVCLVAAPFIPVVAFDVGVGVLVSASVAILLVSDGRHVHR